MTEVEKFTFDDKQTPECRISVEDGTIRSGILEEQEEEQYND